MKSTLIVIEVAVRDGADARSYQLTSVATERPSCVLVKDQAKDGSTQVELCLRATGADYQLDVARTTASGGSSFETKASALVTSGVALELGGTQRHLAITVK